MKHTYTIPSVEIHTVEMIDVLTGSLTNGGEGGSVYKTQDWNDLFV